MSVPHGRAVRPRAAASVELPPVAPAGRRRPPRSTEAQLAIQYQVARALSEADDVEVVAERVLAILCEGLGWSTAALWRLGDADGGSTTDDGRLACVAIWARPDLGSWRSLTMDTRVASGEGLPGRVWASGTPIWITDLARDTNFPRRRAAGEVGLRHAVAFPVLTGGRVQAVIECFGPRMRASDATLVAFLEAIGRQLGAFLERVETRRALAMSEARKTSILEAAVDAIVSADAHGRILDFNSAAERLFGRSRRSVIGRRVGDLLVPKELRSAHRAGLDRFLRTGQRRIMGQRIRTQAHRPDGRNVPVELTVTDTVVDGRPVFTAFIRDITEQRQAEIARDRFLEILSHELRTPVTAIYGGSKILARPSTSPQAAATLLEDIGAESDRLYRMVEDLIVLARAERGASDATLEPLLLDRLVDRLVTTEQEQWPAVTIQVRRALGGGPPVLGEETYVEQVLRNLISNAVKYASGSGDVDVELEFGERAGGEREGRVRVLDRGPGVRVTEAARLFEIDYRSSLTQGVAKGSGIGLFVARWLIESMGGRIWAAPRPGGGSEFGFALPVLQDDDDGLPVARHVEL